MKKFQIKQPKNIGDVYSQSFDGLRDLGNFTYKNTIKLFGTMKSHGKIKEDDANMAKKKDKKKK